MRALSFQIASRTVAAMVLLMFGATNAAKAEDLYIGQIIWLANSFCPTHTLPADGSLLQINDNVALFALLGTTYGGDGAKTFALPDLRGRVPMGVGESLNPPRSLGQSGRTVQGRHASTAQDARRPIATVPYLVLQPCIAISGIFPPRL